MHRIALRNSARKVALAAAPKVRSPTFPLLFLRTNHFYPNRTARFPRAHMLQPSLVCLSVSSKCSLLIRARLLPPLLFNPLPCSCIRGFFNIRVPHLRHVGRRKRRGNRSRFECVGFFVPLGYSPLNHFLGVGDGIGRVWGLKNVQGTVLSVSLKF